MFVPIPHIFNHSNAVSFIVRVIKSRRIRWAEHIARMGESTGVYTVLWGNLKDKDNYEDPGVDGRIILRWSFRKWDVTVWTGSMWIRWRVLVNAVMNLRVP
jgi:hypothetical protein